MRRWWVSCLLLAMVGAVASAQTPRLSQNDRRNRMFPELVVESGGRQGTCDVLTFTADGKHLLAAGDDKVVRMWKYRDGEVDGLSQVLRWSVWREQRGAIYALAVSPDAEGRRLAIGGLGPYPTTVAVLDRQSGEVLHSVFAIDEKQKNLFFGSVRAAAFSPEGERIAFGSSDGSVWLWRPESKRPDALRRLGPRVPPRSGTINRIRLLHFRDEQRLLSVAQNGQVLEWNLKDDSAAPHELPLLEGVGDSVFEAKMSANGKWLAATATAKPLIAVRSLDGTERKDITLVKPQVAVSLAFAGDGRRLAVAIRSHESNEQKFILEGDDQIRLYDLSGEEARLLKKLPHSWRVDCLAFPPDGNYLAVAGGENHEVTLWDLDRPKKPMRVLRGQGSGLWSVALSEDGRSLGFRTQRDPAAAHPNARGRGPWTIFDLRTHHLHPNGDGFTPQPQLEEQDGWRIVPTRKPYIWKVRHTETGTEHDLPLNQDFEAMPRCFAFLPRQKGQPVRVAVGHYYGVSVYEVKPEGVRRIWLGAGHQGEVMALAVSAQGDWVVSASNDQTISAWKLNDWPSSSELGASFRDQGDRVFIDKVDLFSPAWEAGLVERDEIVQLMVGPKLIFRRPDAGGDAPPKGNADNCMEELTAPEPGQTLSFRILRDGSKEVVKKQSTVRRRPLWRFFPTRKNEWVLWMWGQHYYDTSTNGDSFIGWQINRGVEMEKTPSFYKAERFRDVFQQEVVLDKLLATRDVRTALKEVEGGLEPPRIGDIVATVVRIEPQVQRVKDADVKVNLSIEPRTGNDDYAPQRAELWINDHRLQVWKLNGQPLRTTVTIKRESLRAGDNDLVFQCYNQVQGRGQGRVEETARVHCVRAVGQRNLYGLVVGVSDYSRSATAKNGKPLLSDLPTAQRAVGVSDYSRSATAKNGKPLLSDLPTAQRDAEALREACLAQKGLLYKKVDVELLPSKTVPADRATILKKLKQLAAKAGPDDQVFLFFAGHGDVMTRNGKGSFVFCCPDYDPARTAETTLSARELQEALADIACRKIVFLDACRAGHIAGQPIRDLTPGGRGPIILAACDRGESAYEIKGQAHALFATAILEATGAGFRRADRDGDNQLDPQELYDYTFRRVPELLKIFAPKRSQTPSCFPPELERYPLVRQKTPVGK